MTANANRDNRNLGAGAVEIGGRVAEQGGADNSDKDGLAVRLWLYVIALMVFAMVVVGGATRLTDSGLSITEWKPIVGIIPPLSMADWLETFEKYKQIPEYTQVNEGMSLAQFKGIFWWEWAHRFLGRMIGFVFALPFIYFLVRRRISRQLMPRLLGLFALGGVQGFAGWYMVKSGLVDRVDVSHYRLALHLALAVMIFGFTLWTAFRLRPRHRNQVGFTVITPVQNWISRALVGLIFLQIILGALVAGLKAGLAYNSWPLMDGQFIPDGLGIMSPWFENLFENAMTVQFNHRMMAYVIALLVVGHALSVLMSSSGGVIKRSALVLAFALLLQVALGIWTLLAHVPLNLALVHQAMAVIVFGLAVWHRFTVRRAQHAPAIPISERKDTSSYPFSG